MKALLVGLGDDAENFAGIMQRSGCDVVADGAADIVLLGDVRSLSDVKPYVQALCHVFVREHQLHLNELAQLEKLLAEAGVMLQFSLPQMYEWRIADLFYQLNDVKFIQVYKDFDICNTLNINNLRVDVLASSALVRARLSRVERLRTGVSQMSNTHGFRADFTNTVSAYFWMSSNMIEPRHELRIFGSRGMATVDVIAREMKVKLENGEVRSEPFLSAADAVEKELTAFVQSVQHGKASPCISTTEAMVLRYIEEKNL